jgi:hypothetical protein
VECYGLDSSGSGQGQVADFCEHSNVPSGSIKDREFFLSDTGLKKHRLLIKTAAQHFILCFFQQQHKFASLQDSFLHYVSVLWCECKLYSIFPQLI